MNQRQDERHLGVTSGGLKRRELVLIAGFWTFMGVLIAANRLVDLRGGFRAPPASAAAALAFVECYFWALLTPLIFSLASRFSGERVGKVRRIVVFLAVGAVVAVVVANVMNLVRDALLPPPPPRRLPTGSFASRSRFLGLLGPPLWALNDFIIYMGVLAAGLARDFSLRYRARQQEAVALRAQLAEARLDALRRQLDPHFLFNTLHAVSSLVERDPRGVRRMISRLSDLLRHSIEGAADQEIELEEELELLERYLDIMRIRFQGRLEVEVHVAPDARDAMVPNLMLQPIVENAIRHGVSRVDGVGRISIDVARENGNVLLRVRDNGPGPDVTTDAPSDEPGGVGIRNTVERLHELYGNAGSFTLTPAPEGGTVAEIRIPYRSRPTSREGDAA
jgi:two-component system LytT family sensor kinase